jgi:hypothetical protein
MEMSALDYEDSLAHYGILRKSGRYPWGSGANPYQRSKSFLEIYNEHKANGLSDAEIAKLYDDSERGFPFTSTDVRAIKSRAVNEAKQAEIRQAQRLKDKGMGYSEIARRMSGPDKTYNESTIRSYLEQGRINRLDTLQKTAEMLKRQVDEKGIIDVGVHVERDLPIGDTAGIGISKDKFNVALSMLKEEGYVIGTFGNPQVGTGDNTTYRVLFKAPRKGMTEREINHYAFIHRNDVQLISEKSRDGGKSWDELSFRPPLNIDPKRILVKYKDDGGADADGVIYVRPGVKDIELGSSHYAQVRIAVGGTHFLKGMAIYKTDLPPGVDLVFNTSKAKTANKLDAMKEMNRGKDGKVDWTNPFGAFPKIGGQILDKDGHPTSAMNKLTEQGDWDKWSRTLSSQFLSKQRADFAKAQLDVTYERKVDEFHKLKALENPVIKRKLLESFSDDVDSSAVHLKAANMPRQATKVILPVKSLKPGEVYAPGFRNGEKIALVRFPHAGTFEIPQLTVNNRNPEAKRLFTRRGKEIDAPDVIGIHPKVAEHLSGADFDGDTVVAIPNRRGVVRSTEPLKGLKNFDPRESYAPHDGMRTIDGGTYNAKTKAVDYPKDRNGNPIVKKMAKGNEMGKVTNLISDMTVKGANEEEISAAVRHSMVVIDAEKHHLDYKASERENGIPALKQKYQAGVNEKGNRTSGASTLLTRATAPKVVPQRKDAPSTHPGHSGKGVVRTSIGTIDRKTGEKVYVPKGNKDSKGRERTFQSKKLAETTDAFALVSDRGGQHIERIYAVHSNRLKKLANEARLEVIRTKPEKKLPSSAQVYHKEVASLKSKLDTALRNAPLERRAQLVANQIVAQRHRANHDMDLAEKKKIKGQALKEARERINAKKVPVDITDREWEAIQHRAISPDMLKKILNNTDVDKLKERATPRVHPVMTSAMTTRAKQMRSSGATYAEISDALGIPASTLQSSIGAE